MGGCTFQTVATGKTAAEAFRAAREQAQYDNGHAGYTGTIAEKHKFVMVTTEKLAVADAEALAEKLIDKCDPRIDDKWGPAGCVGLTDGRWLFFGWASE